MLFRILALVFLALFLGQTGGVWALVEADDCQKCCPAESPGDECPPTCDLCTCCPGVRSVVVPQAEILAAPDSDRPVFLEAVRAISAPDPREILHVPKLLS